MVTFRNTIFKKFQKQRKSPLDQDPILQKPKVQKILGICTNLTLTKILEFIHRVFHH